MRAPSAARIRPQDGIAADFFRGVLIDHSFSLTDQRMTEAWCANVLRFVAPRMWLGSGLFDQLDRAAVECVASVSLGGDVSPRKEKRLLDGGIRTGVVADFSARKPQSDRRGGRLILAPRRGCRQIHRAGLLRGVY